MGPTTAAQGSDTVMSSLGMGKYWTPAAVAKSDGPPKVVEAKLEALQGPWQHSQLGMVEVYDDNLMVGDIRFKLKVNRAKVVQEVAGWLLVSFDIENGVHWANPNTGERCVWTRSRSGPKRDRVTSIQQLEAERDREEVNNFMRHNSGRAWLYQTENGDWVKKEKKNPLKEKPSNNPNKEGKVEPATVEAPPPAPATALIPVQPRVPIQVTEAELRRLNKEMKKRFAPAKDTNDGGFSCSGRSHRHDGELREKKPGYLHLQDHDPDEWGGWERLVPHEQSMESMAQLEKAGFPLAGEADEEWKLKKDINGKYIRDWPELTAETARQSQASTAILTLTLNRTLIAGNWKIPPTWPGSSRSKLRGPRLITSAFSSLSRATASPRWSAKFPARTPSKLPRYYT